jgi:hypothetical protein
MKTSKIAIVLGGGLASLTFAQPITYDDTQLVAGWNFPAVVGGDPVDSPAANISGSQSGATIDFSSLIQPSFDLQGTRADSIGFHQVGVISGEGIVPTIPAITYFFGFEEPGSGTGGAVGFSGAMGNSFSQGGFSADRGESFTINFSASDLSRLYLQYDVKASGLFQKSNTLEISLDGGSYNLLGMDDLTSSGGNYATVTFDLSAAGADNASQVSIRYTISTDELDSFSGDPSGDGSVQTGLYIDNILIYSKLGSFWADSPADSNGWRNSGEAYDNYAGIGWINDSQWPFIYAVGFEESVSSAHWVYVQESGNIGEFYAYVFNGSNSYWAYVYDGGSVDGTSWYYNFSTSTWVQIVL